MHNRVALSEFRRDIDLPDYPYPGHRELLDADKNVAAQYWLLLCISIECVDRWLRLAGAAERAVGAQRGQGRALCVRRRARDALDDAVAHCAGGLLQRERHGYCENDVH
eukprot:607305-Rhodomonas_salina.1